ncbi:RNA-binding protein, partial [Pseudoalteromonas piscicida]
MNPLRHEIRAGGGGSGGRAFWGEARGVLPLRQEVGGGGGGGGGRG